MFASVVAGFRNGPFRTFPEAFVNFFPRVLALIEAGRRLEDLDTTSWIEGKFDGRRMLLSLYDARDFAYMVGILAGSGELQNPLPEIDPIEVRHMFLTYAMVTVMAAQGEAQQDPVGDDSAVLSMLP
jgi:hypothetical protein